MNRLTRIIPFFLFLQKYYSKFLGKPASCCHSYYSRALYVIYMNYCIRFLYEEKSIVSTSQSLIAFEGFLSCFFLSEETKPQWHHLLIWYIWRVNFLSKNLCKKSMNHVRTMNIYIHTSWNLNFMQSRSEIFQLFASKLVDYSRNRESLNIRKKSKSATFSFENNDLYMFQHSSKAHCDSNDWTIWTQKVPKEA